MLGIYKHGNNIFSVFFSPPNVLLADKTQRNYPYLFQTVTELHHELDDIIRSHGYPVNAFSSFAYDAIWSIALTLHQASYILDSQNKHLSNFTYGDNETAILFRDILRNLSFYGMSASNYLLCPYFNVLRVPLSEIESDFTL